MYKQVIVIRKDLHMRTGKMIAQACHSSMKIFFDRMNYVGNYTTKPISKFIVDGNNEEDNKPFQDFYCIFTEPMLQWLTWENGQEGFTKIVVGCNSEQELYEIEKKAKEAHIPNALIIDNGHTEFHEVKTPTCICLGPDDAEKIDKITGELKLL